MLVSTNVGSSGNASWAGERGYPDPNSTGNRSHSISSASTGRVFSGKDASGTQLFYPPSGGNNYANAKPPFSASSPSLGTPTASTPPVGSTGVSSPSTSSASPASGDTSANARQTTSNTSSASAGLLDFERMFEYQKRINRELDMPTLRETNQEGYKYRKMEGDDQMGRDTSARRDAAALAMQRDVLSSNLERGTMRQQQALQTRTKDQDLARAMSVLMKRKR